MAVNAGILKAVVSFYRIDSETAFERHVSRIPIKCKRRMDAEKHLISFLGLWSCPANMASEILM